MQQLVLVRHGQSQWNLENRFTGWVDVALTEKGREEARRAGQSLKAQGFVFKKAYTSVLKRAISTCWTILEETDQLWIPVEKHWRLNERHYGGLQGLNKEETKDRYGAEQVFQWRRGYDQKPPEAKGPLQEEQQKDPRYGALLPEEFPKGEGLKHTLDRVWPYWEDHILKEVQKGGDFLITAHGNSLRALVKGLSGMGDQEITEFEFPTATPLICQLNRRFQIQEMNWLSPK